MGTTPYNLRVRILLGLEPHIVTLRIDNLDEAHD